MTVNEFPGHALSELLLEAEKNRPNDVYVFSDRAYTFTDVARAARAMALDLRAAGLKEGDHVGILGLNSVNWIISFYAIQFVGGVAALMNPGLTFENVKETISRFDLKAICVGEAVAVREVMTLKNAYPILSSIDFTLRPEPEAFEIAARKPEDPALIIFTSGSTGAVKGVVHSSCSFGHLSGLVYDRIIPGAGARICAFLPFFHIFGSCLFLGIDYATGGTLYLPKSSRSEDVLNMIYTHKCTGMPCVPQLLLAMINNPAFAPHKVDSLMFSLVGGTPVPSAQWHLIRKHFQKTTFVDIYGLSESAPVTISMPTDDVDRLTHTVGKVCTGVEVKIDAPDADTPGEILVKSPATMLGYYLQSEMSSGRDEDGWFHTGDMGFLDAEGYIRISGRLKEIIIRSGENIFPNEVASVMAKYPAVADVKVLGLPHPFYGEVVSAAIILRKEMPFHMNEFMKYCAQKLEKEKRPEHVFCYEAFPMLASGKVDMVTLKKQMLEHVAKSAK